MSATTQSRYDLGKARLRAVLPDADDRMAKLIPHPDLERYIVEWVYGDLHDRTELSARDRELVTITVLATLGGCDDLLAGHVDFGRRAGLRPQEILEAILQCAAYAGIPRAIKASQAARRVLGGDR